MISCQLGNEVVITHLISSRARKCGHSAPPETPDGATVLVAILDGAAASVSLGKAIKKVKFTFRYNLCSRSSRELGRVVKLPKYKRRTKTKVRHNAVDVFPRLVVGHTGGCSWRPPCADSYLRSTPVTMVQHSARRRWHAGKSLVVSKLQRGGLYGELTCSN